MKSGMLRIGKWLGILSVACLGLSGCHTTPTTGEGTAIDALCWAWGNSLPTRSRDDTERTRRDIGRAYDVFEAACDRPAPLEE